jgi:hypothetical protein
MVRNAFLRINEPNISPHSLRKYLQTTLEAANVNTNWIDQILGHKLINSRDAYSKPTNEQLKEAYTKAYKFLRVYPTHSIQTKTRQPQSENPTQNTEYIVKTATNIQEATQLIENGFEYITEMDGTKLFRKRK